MEETTRYILQLKMDVDPEKEEAYNRIYDAEHIPYMLEVPGVISAARYESIEGTPKYTTIYEIENPEVLDTEAWKRAVAKGQYMQNIRPFTKNTSKAIFKQIYPKSV